MREVVTLQQVDPQIAAGFVLFGCLDAFRDRLGVDLRSEVYQHFHEILFDRFARQRRDQAPRDFEIVRRERGDRFERGVSGSGYASLEAIAALSPDYLKVTRGLVSTLAREPIKQDLVKMLVDLAAKINAKTIAEGIETAEEYETCRDLGVDLLQGYYLAHPQEQLGTGDAEVANLAGTAQASS